jgi:RNA polymerase sigma-70 factor (ECF subfamily)
MQPSEKAMPPSVSASAAVPAGGTAERGVTLDEAMDRYARGDAAVFDELFRQAAPRLRGFLLRMCGDAALADDLTQEAFFRVHLARGSFIASSAALPWMLAIARNAFLDHTRRESVRRVARKQAAESDDEPLRQASPDTRGDEVLAARETLEIVRRTLDSIPTIQREAFVLLRFEGLSVSQAAQVLGASESAVKVRAFRAYEALRSALQKQSEGDSRRK